jgi:hypothetical protein
LCDEDLTKDLIKKISKNVCKKTKKVQEEYRHLSDTKGGKKIDKTDGVVIGADFKISVSDKKKKNKRLPSYADYLILKLTKK